jgi:hypothetical protein
MKHLSHKSVMTDPSDYKGVLMYSSRKLQLNFKSAVAAAFCLSGLTACSNTGSSLTPDPYLKTDRLVLNMQ